MERRKTDCEISEEHAKRELLKHVHCCLVCSNDERNTCSGFTVLAYDWRVALEKLNQERRGIAGCS